MQPIYNNMFLSGEKKKVMFSPQLFILSYPLAAVTLCLGNAPASLVGLGSTATRRALQDSMASHVSRSAAAKMVLTAIV